MVTLLSVTVLGAWASDASSFGGGDGSAKNPYLITTAAQWDQLVSDVNGRRLSGKPTAKGLYIHGNRKVVVK